MTTRLHANDKNPEEAAFYNDPAIAAAHVATIILTYWKMGKPATVHGALTASPRLNPETVIGCWDVAENAAKFIAHSMNLKIPSQRSA